MYLKVTETMQSSGQKCKYFILKGLSLLMIALSACVSHKVNSLYGPCHTQLSDTKILLEANALIGPSRGLHLVEELNSKLASCGGSAFYQQSLEMELWAKGVKDLSDTANYPALSQLGFTHLLLISNKSSHSKEGYIDSRTQRELDTSPQAYDEDMEERVSIDFQLISIQYPKTESYVLTVTTTVSPLAIKNKDDFEGETYLNLASSGKATARALKKGIIEIRENCSCK